MLSRRGLPPILLFPCFCCDPAYFLFQLRSQGMPELSLKPLKALPDGAAPASTPGSNPADSSADAMAKLEKFTDSLHQKASQLTTWIVALSDHSSPRATKFQTCNQRIVAKVLKPACLLHISLALSEVCGRMSKVAGHPGKQFPAVGRVRPQPREHDTVGRVPRLSGAGETCIHEYHGQLL